MVIGTDVEQKKKSEGDATANSTSRKEFQEG